MPVKENEPGFFREHETSNYPLGCQPISNSVEFGKAKASQLFGLSTGFLRDFGEFIPFTVSTPKEVSTKRFKDFNVRARSPLAGAKVDGGRYHYVPQDHNPGSKVGLHSFPSYSLVLSLSISLETSLMDRNSKTHGNAQKSEYYPFLDDLTNLLDEPIEGRVNHSFDTCFGVVNTASTSQTVSSEAFPKG